MAAPTQPRKLGMIGLSGSGVTSWAASAHLPVLLTDAGKKHYTIAALLNSSETAAKTAIDRFGLDASSVRAYGSPEDLAADQNVQVVSCNARVDNHRDTILPSLKAGKDVYVEWPIASNRAQVAEVVAAARASGSRVAVGLQGRWAPPVLKLKEFVKSGRLGRVLSSEFRAYGGVKDRAQLPTGLKYFADRKVGGNDIVIGFGHAIDWVQSVLGELDMASTHAHLQIQRPKRTVVEVTGSERKPVGSVESDVPDLISVHGTLTTSSVVAPGASLIASFRTGQPFPGHPPLLWTINCEHGEIRLRSMAGAILHQAYEEPVTLHYHDFASDSVEEIPWAWGPDMEALPSAARCVQRCLLAFSEGDESGYVALDDAARRAEQIFTWMDQEAKVSAKMQL